MNDMTTAAMHSDLVTDAGRGSAPGAAAPVGSELMLAYGFAFDDLYRRDGLSRLDARFAAYLAAVDGDLHTRLMGARAAPDVVAAKDESELLIALAPHLEDFIAELFRIRTEIDALAARHHALAPLYSAKRLFVQRRAAKQYNAAAAAAFEADELRAALEPLLGGEFSELRFAEHAMRWMEAPDDNAAALDLALRYAAWALHTPQGQREHRDGVLFKLPHKVDPLHLVPVETHVVDGVTMLRLPPAKWRAREGFGLTDQGTDLTGALDHANYCIWCHNQGKDSCSRGLSEKAGGFKTNSFGTILAGCPLDEKISEMHLMKKQGDPIASLALVTIDNPMCAGTGHRICNDCMKGCIFQKQEPVNIPLVETSALTDVLDLPYGFEIYALLSRWNPLNALRPYPLPYNGKNVLVVGLGPAGYTLAHYLLNEGFGVIGFDGLKIEPLDEVLHRKRTVRSARCRSKTSTRSRRTWTNAYSRDSAAFRNTVSPFVGTRTS